MKATFDIDAGLLENADEFEGAFYKRFALRHAPAPLQLNEQVSKNYLFPTFYGDVTCAIGIFLCSYDKAAAMMPHPRMKPIRITRGRSLVAFSCYVYRKVLGVAPYNEIAMTIPLMVDPGVNVPVLPMLTDWFKAFGYYVFSMPVTSLENQIRGVKIWGLPKVVQGIDIREEDGDCVTTAKEESGETYFDLRVPTNGKPADFDVSSNLYTVLDNRLLQSETNFQGTFNVQKFPALLFKKGALPDRAYLTLGDTPSGRVLKDLEIEAHPFQFRYAKTMHSAFDLANPDYKAPFDLS